MRGTMSVELANKVAVSSSDPADTALTVDQRRGGAFIDTSSFVGANVNSKIKKQQNFTCDSLTINYYGGDQVASDVYVHDTKTQPGNDSVNDCFGESVSSELCDSRKDPVRLRKLLPYPIPRPRSTASASGRTDGINEMNQTTYSTHSCPHGAIPRPRIRIRNSNPHPLPRHNIGGMGGQAQPDYFIMSPHPRSPLPQPRQNARSQRYTQVAANIWFFNVKPLRDLSQVYDGLLGRTPVIVKLIPHSAENLGNVHTLLQLKDHQNITKVHDSGTVFGLVKEIFIAMEVCSHNLREYIRSVEDKPLNFSIYSGYAKQLLTGLAFLHDHEIVHGNLKPDNILFTANMETIKISDCGFWKKTFHGEEFKDGTFSLPGTEGYRAPEVYYNPPELTQSSDVFSMGVVLFYLFTHGCHPFGKKSHDWGYNIRYYKNRDLSLLYRPQVPVVKKPRLFYMIDGALHRNANSRPTAKVMLENLFFKDASSAFSDPLNHRKPVQKIFKSRSHDDLFLRLKTEQQLPRRRAQYQYLSLQDLSDLPDQPSEEHILPIRHQLLAKHLALGARKQPPSFSFIKSKDQRSMKLDFEDHANISEFQESEESSAFPIRSNYHTSDSFAPAASSYFNPHDPIFPNLYTMRPMPDSILRSRIANIEHRLSSIESSMSHRSYARSHSGFSVHSSFSRHAEQSFRCEPGCAMTPNMPQTDMADQDHFDFECTRHRSYASVTENMAYSPQNERNGMLHFPWSTLNHRCNTQLFSSDSSDVDVMIP